MQSTSDAIIPRYRALVEAGRRHGTRVFAQLCHPGFRPLPGVPIIEQPPHAPGPEPEPRRREEPTVSRLRGLIQAFGAAAGRAAAGGADGVELHSHESFLHAQMLNPYWNHRTDEYGGSLENRMRFLVETLQAMRRAIGPDSVLGVRLKLDDIVQRGMGPEDYREAVRRLEALELIDYVNFTGGDGRFHHGPTPRPEGEWLPLVKAMRAATKLTIMHAGRIATPEMAERAVAQGWVDMVCMTKAHICDPHHARKAYENRLDDIRYCTRCLQSCHGKMHEMTCVYNPFTRRELEWGELKPAAVKRRIVVVGAGPAGMEAALTAAQRGHEVVVLERGERVGGQIWAGAASPLRKPWARIAEFYERQSRKGLFKVRLRTEASVSTVLALRPDAVVLATGSQPVRLPMEGGPPVRTVHEAVGGSLEKERRVVVYDREGFNRALVAADYLSSRSVQIDFVSPDPRIGRSVESMMMDEMAHQLTARHVRFYPGEEIVGWEMGRIKLRQSWDGLEHWLDDVDAVVGLVGSRSHDPLSAELKGRVEQVILIGDAKEPRTVEEATTEGAAIARAL
jgi:2,4-dienoyl-CoA reductase-like NADH-dependent reductase (Old Yellow Enzyme family)